MKKKILIIAVAACLLALTIAGTSIAYFTDTEEYTNVFTSGKVDITLTYNTTTVNDNLETDGTIELTTHAYPGQSYPINATIKNVGTENAYVGAIITLTDADLSDFVVAAGDGSYPVAVRTLLAGLANANDYHARYTLTTVTDDNGNTTQEVLTIYVVSKNVLVKENECKFLGSIDIPATWDNDEMAAFAGLKLNVIAYATQTVGFNDNAETAITTAFETQWAGYAGATALN